MQVPIYIPTYISSINYAPARVLPHVYFYNGLNICQKWWFEHRGTGAYSNYIYPEIISSSATNGASQSVYPYFENYSAESGSFPGTGSHSLLFNNEDAIFGATPTSSLFSNYYEKYIELLYNPKTRLIEASAIIPFADYNDLYLNDIIEWRGNYYHLRAINNYSIKTGECNLQLLGPILKDALDYINGSCNFAFTSNTFTTTTTTTTTAGPTTTTTAGPTTTTTAGPTTTTTAGPTTTTTTLPSSDYAYYNTVACANTSSTSVIRVANSITGSKFGENWTYFDLGTKVCMTSTTLTTPQAVSMTISDAYTADRYVFGNNYLYPGQCDRCQAIYPPTGSCYTSSMQVKITGQWAIGYTSCADGTYNYITGSAAAGTIISTPCYLYLNNYQNLNNLGNSVCGTWPPL